MAWLKKEDLKQPNSKPHHMLGRKLSIETKLKMSEAHKGKPSGMLGKHHTLEARLKFSDKHNGRWRGDSVSDRALHLWVERKLDKPNECENCETTVAKRYEWANISGEYKREINDWARLCSSCHRHYDNHGVKAQITKQLNKIMVSI